jgi:hypothetical protein
MTQMTNDELSGAGDVSAAKMAQVIPFERPPSDVQRALQERAQSLIDRERERRVRKPEPLKWAIMLALALVPVVFLLTAVDGFLRVFHQVNELYKDLPAPEVAAEPASEVSPVWVSDEPGVVLLQPLEAGDAGGARPAPEGSAE